MKLYKTKLKWKMSPWWQSTTSAITGTIIGIIVTFGTSAYLEQKNKEENEHLAVMMVLNNISAFTNKLENNIANMERTDTLFRRIILHDKHNIRQAGADTALLFINSLNNMNFQLLDKTSEKIFSSSMSTWQDIDNPVFIENVGKCFSLMELAEKTYQELDKERFSLYNDFRKEHDVNELTLIDVFAMIYSMPKTTWFMQKYNVLYLPFLKMATQTLREQNRHNMEMMGISDEELRQFADGNAVVHYEAKDFQQ